MLSTMCRFTASSASSRAVQCVTGRSTFLRPLLAGQRHDLAELLRRELRRGAATLPILQQFGNLPRPHRFVPVAAVGFPRHLGIGEAISPTPRHVAMASQPRRQAGIVQPLRRRQDHLGPHGHGLRTQPTPHHPLQNGTLGFAQNQRTCLGPAMATPSGHP